MRSSSVLPAGSLRQREYVLLRSGRDHHGCRCLRRGGLAFGVSSRPVSRREMAGSMFVRVVAACSAAASLLLGAAANARRRRRFAPMVLVALLGGLLALGCAPERPPRPPPSGEVIVAAGDIADCSSEGDEET